MLCLKSFLMLTSITLHVVCKFSHDLVKFAKNDVFLCIFKIILRGNSPVFSFLMKRPTNLTVLVMVF